MLLIGVTDSVTRLGNLLDFGQLFKACGDNYFAKIAHIFRQFLGIFLVKSFLGNFYRHLAKFYWSHLSRALPTLTPSRNMNVFNV